MPLMASNPLIERKCRQDYGPPPGLCLRNGTTCAQGDVPLYAVNATTVGHIQVHDSSRSVNVSAHLFLGRYTIRPGSRPTRRYQIFRP